MLTSDIYVSIKGLKCPNCLSTNIEGGDIEAADEGMAYQNICCLDCGSIWVDHYKLTGYDELQIGDKTT